MAEETAEHILTDCDGVRHLYPQEWAPLEATTQPERTLAIWQAWLGQVTRPPDA